MNIPSEQSTSSGPVKDAVNTPLRAARDNNEVMSQRHPVPGMDEIEAKWKQQVGAARIAWSKLTESELLQFQGRKQKLSGLVQERYAITRDEANKQVNRFFEKHMS